MSKRKIILISVPLLIILLVLGCGIVVQYKFKNARRVWKTTALQQIDSTSFTDKKILSELDQIRNPTSDLNFGWAHEHVILMENGEFLVYAWLHGSNNGLVDHLFLAHGTDGKWYYSTYHFCNRMAAILGDKPANTISEFSKRYFVYEFDGKSDECLKHTWPTK